MLHPKTPEWKPSSCSSQPHRGHWRRDCSGMDWGGDVGCRSFCTLVTFALSSLGHGGDRKENKVSANHLGKAS